MQKRLLGNSGIEVTSVCLGTMTFGQQNSETEAHRQLDHAMAAGINFIDTAEMYPVPPREPTQGRTESYVGSWLQHQRREDVVLASKITGPRRGYDWLRGGPRITRQQIEKAIDDSLRRLCTDYLDLYQIHWPDRYVPMFGETQFDASQVGETEAIAQQIEALADLVKAGKIRAIGLSNETPYGVMAFDEAAGRANLPRVTSIQNAYHLMNRTFEEGLAEVCHYRDVGLLAYSPLAFGVLSGKYLRDPRAPGRITEFPGFGQRYGKPNVLPALTAYVDLAEQHGLTPAQLAIAFVHQRPFTRSVIIGATDLDQLAENIGAAEITLSDEVLDAIDAIHLRFPNPAP